MNCIEFEARLHPYVDGELDVNEMPAANAHLAQCEECQARLERERQFRQLLRRQPRESAPPEFRAMIGARIRRSARLAAIRPWLVGTAAAAAVLLVVSLLPGLRPGSSLTTHFTYALPQSPTPGVVLYPSKISFGLIPVVD